MTDTDVALVELDSYCDMLCYFFEPDDEIRHWVYGTRTKTRRCANREICKNAVLRAELQKSEESARKTL